MNNILHSDFFKKLSENFEKHQDIFYLSMLFVLSIIFLFIGIGNYQLIDVDESRYAVMARDLFNSNDLNCLMLNGVPFLEKPPLYFWLVGISYKLFNAFNPFTVRFPIALCTMGLVYATYYVGRQVISRLYGMISAVVLLSSVFFLILSHVAILDMLITIFVALCLYCGILTHYCEEKNKKYYWFAFYVFMGLGVLSKGILAIALPCTVLFIFNLITKTAKDIFKPINMLPGLVVFLLIVTPWHYIMMKDYGYEFFKQYILAHHFARFINSETIGRERPWYYFFFVFFLGFLPWSILFIDQLVQGAKKVIGKIKEAQGNFFNKMFAMFNVETKEEKFIMFAFLSFAIIFCVFSSSSTKLPTYILPAFPSAALLVGYYLHQGYLENKNQNVLKISTTIFGWLFAIVAIGGFVAWYFLPENLQTKLAPLRFLDISCILISSIILIMLAKTKNALKIAGGYVLFSAVIILLTVLNIFNFVYENGENEIVNYSIHSEMSANSQIVNFDFAVKPSVMIHAKKVIFITDPLFDELDKALNYKDGITYVIVKNKNFKDNQPYKDAIESRLTLVETGERYSLYKNK
ncbi:MAG: glycosyltransferase family 39 protein [bacterium]|nr:glycosyltransferase family 39 protein [bacterium]